MSLRSCVTPAGSFCYGVHKPVYQVRNLRTADYIEVLGSFGNGAPFDNRANFPVADVEVENADWVFEIANPLPFRGTTYISRAWAESRAGDLKKISLPQAAAVSMSVAGRAFPGLAADAAQLDNVFLLLPKPVKLALAACSTDPDDLARLARGCCDFDFDSAGRPNGLKYEKDKQGLARPVIFDLHLFEVLGNNPHLPDAYRQVMVLRPGAQGSSEIVGEYPAASGSHVFEYLRRNSYIPWGHFAANMANDEVRYAVSDLGATDMTALRHLYYQRTYVRLAEELGLPLPGPRQNLSDAAVEELRRQVAVAVRQGRGARQLKLDATLWGWNYGFDFSPSGYRLHASHQQVHHQFAMIPARMPAGPEPGDGAPGKLTPFCCGDLVADFISEYRREHRSCFFTDYTAAIRSNQRLDREPERESSLIVFEDDHVMLFVPKAQTSQWELQLMTLGPTGNILEADAAVRQSLDRGILTAMRVLGGLGARMVTTVEYSKRFTAGDNGQRLLYAFLPRLPDSPGGMSEAQLRWIVGHYPEDFAAACRAQLPAV